LILFRHCDRRFPFLWESSTQPGARWHAEGEGPVQYFADTPSGAWAEFLRHEGVREEKDLDGIRRALWAVEVPVEALDVREPALDPAVLRGGPDAYPRCQAQARRLRNAGAQAVRAPSAALKSGAAAGWVVDGGERGSAPRDGVVLALFGGQAACIGWPVVEAGAPPERVLDRVRHF
jgi:hypothetical protein